MSLAKKASHFSFILLTLVVSCRILLLILPCKLPKFFGATILLTWSCTNSSPLGIIRTYVLPPHDVPYIFVLEWSVNSRLKNIVQQFKEHLQKLQEFWSIMESIDKTLFVVNPKVPSLASTYRQISLGNDCYLVLRIDARNPTYLPGYRLLGPDSATEAIRKKWKRNGRKWSNSRPFMENLEILLETNLPGPPKECNIGDDQTDCGICYAHYLPHDDELGDNSGNAPDFKCDNPCCCRAFHTICLRDWLRSITTTRQMVHYFFSVKAQRSVHFLLTIFLFLTPSLLLSLAPGKPFLKLSEVTQKGEGKDEIIEGSMIGSRPPLCLGICRACGRCEAVQVPAIPQHRNVGGKVSAAMNVVRGDDSSNYKPLSWKCKCGDLIVNP